MGLNRRLRRQAFLEQHGRYYLTGPAGSSGSGQGHPFRSKWAATKWAAVRSKISRQDWRVYRFDR